MSDDTLWPICVIANIIANGLDKVFVTTKQNGEASSQTTTGTGCDATAEQCQQAINVNISALSDH